MKELGEPVDMTTLVVEMLERGYEPVTDEKTLKKSLGAALGRNHIDSESWG